MTTFDPQKLIRIAENIELIGKANAAQADLAEKNREAGEEARLRKRAQNAEESAWQVREAHRLLTVKRHRVTPATAPFREECHLYGKEIGMPRTEVDSWYDHFSSNGWRVGGKTPMKDWKAALRNGLRTFMKGGGRSEKPQASADDPDWIAFMEERGHYPIKFNLAPGCLRDDFIKWQKGKA